MQGKWQKRRPDLVRFSELCYDYTLDCWYSAALPADAFIAWLRDFSSAAVHDIRRERARA